MLLNKLLFLVVVVTGIDALPSLPKIEKWSKLLQNHKNIIINNFQMLQQEWKTFKETHGKKYETDNEDMKRMEIFAHNKLMIAGHNDLYEKDVVTYTVKMNKFGDLTTEEFITYYGINNIEYEKEDENRREMTPIRLAAGVESIPKEKDWRKEGAVTDVKDQREKKCGGSSWAFSATGALEGYYFVKNHYLIGLSEQNLIDCSKNFGNNGCSGGEPKKAFKYVKQNGGIDSETSYPYESNEGKCRFNSTYSIPSAVYYAFVPRGDEKSLKQYVAEYGPVSVMVDVSDPIFRFYESGVYSSVMCSSDKIKLNYAMLVVGYGYDYHGGEYWLVKNSCGKGWGEEGYIRMARNRNNNCGIASEAVLPA